MKARRRRSEHRAEARPRGDSVEPVVTVRDMAPGEEAAVLELVMTGFDEFVRPDLSDEGAAEFERSARSFVLCRPDGHSLFVAEEAGAVVGMLDMRDGPHIALFFVDAHRHGRGIGRSLLAHATDRCRIADPDVRTVTVNSSLWAVPVYERLGFVAVGRESELKGIRFVPMVMRLAAPSPAIDDARACGLCGGSFTVRELLDRVASFWPEVDVVVSRSACCGGPEELRISDGLVERGYVYAAGAPHFCGMEEYVVPGLEVREKGDRLVFALDGDERTAERAESDRP